MPLTTAFVRIPTFPLRHRLPRPLLKSTSLRSRANSLRTQAVLRPNIAVIGGGHAGLSVALRLTTLPWTRLTRPTITLIDRSDRFVFLPMLYELALSQAEEWEVAPRFVDLLEGTAVKFTHGSAENLDLSSGAVEGTRQDIDGNKEFRVPFDRLVLALGAQVAGIDKVPGAREFAVPFYTLADAGKLKKQIESLRKIKTPGEVINVVVVGGGFSGVEIGSCLADVLGTAASIVIVEPSDRLLQRGSNFNRQTAKKALVSNGAVVLYRSRVVEVTRDDVAVQELGNDALGTSRYPADLVIWTAGSRANASMQNFDLPLDDAGRLVTDPLLQVKGFEDHIYALGDAASVTSQGKYSGTAQVAVQQAEYAAWNTWASLMGKPKLQYRYAHLGEMMVLGSKNATVTTSVGVELEGVPAWASRRVAYLARMPTDRHRSRVAASWAANPLLSGMSDLVKESRKYRSNGP